MKFLFWFCLALPIYTFLVYPAILVALNTALRLRDRVLLALWPPDTDRPSDEDPLPLVSLVFSAHNEEAVILEKMHNCAKLNYPVERIEILVGCDGCTDRTAEMARSAGLANACILEPPQRSGKPEMLNRLVPQARGEIVVFCDANTMFEPNAIRRLVRHFADPRVGCASGELRLLSPQTGSPAEGVYWRYEVFLKHLEGRLNMLVGANGGIFAIRRDLFEPLPDRGIIDDFLVAMRIRGRGYRVIYDRDAVAFEETAVNVRQEFQRRVRIGAGNLHALRFTWRMLIPTAGAIAFSYWSHKVCRWLCPIALPAAFFAALALSRHPIYASCALAGAGLALLAYLGYRQERRQRPCGPLSIPYYLVSMNLALLMGFLRCFTGAQTVVWQPILRERAVLEPPES
jgi:cellulose synthase/poly-beta-1,6-N-acetylglucosamine synthase-like glycosyltransferase